MNYTLTIPGTPVPQPRPRISTRGGIGRAYVPKDHPIHAYREAIAAAAKESGVYFKGAVALSVEAVFARPASHWRKHDLRPDAPQWPKADGDNVLKGIADALTDGGAWDDDDQVVEWSIVKRWASRGGEARTVIIVSEADE